MVTTTKQNTPWRGRRMAANNLGLRGLGLVEKARLKGLKAVRQLRSGGAYRGTGLSRKLEPGGRIFRTTRQSAALGRSACKLIGTWFQVPFSRGCWHRDKMSRHTVFTVKTQLRGCLLYAAKACAEWGPHP